MENYADMEFKELRDKIFILERRCKQLEHILAQAHLDAEPEKFPMRKGSTELDDSGMLIKRDSEGKALSMWAKGWVEPFLWGKIK